LQKNKKIKKVKELIIGNIEKNIKEYIIIILLFIIGIIIGVIFINNSTEYQKDELDIYFNSVIEQLKNNFNIDQIGLLKESIGKNLILGLFLWFIGLTVIGIPILYGTIIFRGFCLGYTVSSAIATLGISKGFIFVICTVFMQNIIIIPCMIALGVSGVKLYKFINKRDKKISVKTEIVRHTFFSIFILVLLILSSFIEVYISSNLLTLSISYL